MDKKLQKYLLALARQTLVDYFKTGEKLKINDSDLPNKELAKKVATFVTLTEKGDLRGCIGNLLAKRKMYEDVINNALMAGFGDPRFMPLEESEIKDVKIEISVLSKANVYNHGSDEELLTSIEPKVHGLVLQQNFLQATFLPQVWEEIPDKVKFLEALSQKAGLSKDSWKNPDTEIFYYTVEKFSE